MQKIDEVNEHTFTYIQQSINCLHKSYIDIKEKIENYQAALKNPSKRQEETKNEECQSKSKQEEHKESLEKEIKTHLECGVAGGVKK